jgi:hypothetical protein
MGKRYTTPKISHTYSLKQNISSYFDAKHISFERQFEVLQIRLSAEVANMLSSLFI